MDAKIKQKKHAFSDLRILEAYRRDSSLIIFTTFSKNTTFFRKLFEIFQTVFEDKNPNQPQGVQAQEVDSFVQNAGAQPQNATSQNLPEVEVFTEQPIQKMYQEERQDLAEEGIEILADNTSVEEVSVPEQVAPIQATDHVAQSAPVSAPQEYTIKEEGISENKIDSENIQVQSILQNAQQPLPVGESVQNIAKTHAEDHAEELYYNLPPSAQKTKLDAPIEVATPHYGDPKDGDEHLYRV